MGSGLSMASVNKIKELAAQREYSLALDIIDSQDLSKSLNPQFLRLCGEVFIKSKRYEDARKTLLMARRLTPAAKRIIFSLVDLYMRMGYKSLVEKYYELYMFDADENNEETKQLNYIYDKYCGKSPKELEEYLIPYYINNMEYDWSFETFLLLCMEDKDDVDEVTKKSLTGEYLATFKNSKNSQIIASITDDESIAENLFYNFSKTVEEDNDPKQEKLRKEENKLFEADELRIHPQEAEIIDIIDDEEETKDDLSPEDASEEKEKKPGFFKKLFVRGKNKEASETEEEATDGEEKSEDETEPVEKAAVPEAEAKPETKSDIEDKSEETTETINEDVQAVDNLSEVETEEEADEETSEPVENITETESEVSDNEDFEMHKNVDEINMNMEKFSDDDFSEEEIGDEFAAESDTIEDLHLKEDVSDEDNEQTDEEQTDKKSGVLFESADISIDADEDENYDIDDFSTTVNDEFGSMVTPIENDVEEQEDTEAVTEEKDDEIYEDAGNEFEESVETEEEIKTASEIEEAVETEIEEEVREAIEVETETEEAIEDEVGDEAAFEEITEAEPDTEQIVEEAAEAEPEIEEAVEEIPEEAAENEVGDEAVFEEIIEAEQDTEQIVEEAAEAEPEIEEAVEEIPEEATDTELKIEEAVETESDNIFEEITEIEPKVEAEAEAEARAETEPEVEETVEEEYEEEDLSELFRLEKEKIKNENREKKLEFPVFRSSLFPNYHNDKPEVENNFNEIMSDSQSKISENFEKEAQLQKETEALLASLGIDLGSTKSTVTSTSSIKIDRSEEKANSISRKELKNSLKIGEDKKIILRKMKEYR